MSEISQKILHWFETTALEHHRDAESRVGWQFLANIFDSSLQGSLFQPLEAYCDHVKDGIGFEKFPLFLSIFEQDWVQLVSIAAQRSVEIGDHQAAVILSRLADLSGNLAVRFLSAWVAFNQDNFEQCLEECEKAEQPNAPIYSLQGQVYLETGALADAKECFRIAQNLAPKDPLPLFFLAKIYFIEQDFASALKCLFDCYALRPEDHEVVSFLAIIALNGTELPHQERQRVLDILLGFEVKPSVAFLKTTADLAVELNSKSGAQSTLDALTVSEFQPEERLSGYTGLLRSFHEAGWHDLVVGVVNCLESQGFMPSQS